MPEAKSTILIVDDSRTTRLMLQQALEEFNFIVHQAENGEAAIKLFEQINVDLVLLDVEMPGMDGFTTCKQLVSMSTNTHTPIVIITGSDDLNSINQAYAAGATDFITKPFNWDLLGYRLRYIIRTSSDYRELQANKEMLLKAQTEINKLNDDLEDRVKARTQELIKTNNELKSTQNQLFDSEKMAYIGSLTTSIANEAKIPIDVCNNALADFRNKLNTIFDLFKADELKKSDLNTFLIACLHAENILQVNLQNASAIIKSFKQISIDQIMETRRAINLKEYLEEIIFSLNPALKNTHLQIAIECEDNVIIDTYPGVLFQVISILVMNSITHAFNPDEKGRLTIAVSNEDNRVVIRYSDSGKGMSKEVLKNIFEPFFTTNRSKGYVGLGLHVAYNQVIQILGGTIRCESELGHGTTYTIVLSPIVA